MMKKITLLIFIQFQVYSIFSQQWSSSVVSLDYDSKTNSTNYIVLPLGNVSLPGNWIKQHYNKISHQQFLVNKDSVETAIAFTKCNMYEFSNNNLKDFGFVKAYYEWDSKYLTEHHKLNREIIISDSINQYIVWHLFGDKVNTYYLFGNKNCVVHNYSVTTKKWANEQKISFLQNLYLKNKTN